MMIIAALAVNEEGKGTMASFVDYTVGDALLFDPKTSERPM
jgi:hypothetical protein